MLVIPDPHALPGYDNARFDWLGRFAHDIDPDYVLWLGDLWDFPSMSRHDPLGSKVMEGARYEADVAAGNEAVDRFYTAYKRPRGEHVFLLGNHDVRGERAVTDDPRLEGKVSLSDLNLGPFHRVIPYREIVQIEGICASHHMASGVSGRPIGGENVAGSLVKKKHVSCVVGHGHTFQHFEHTRGDGLKIFGLSAGCYTHEKYGRDGTAQSSWCKDTADMWWRGVVVLEDLDGQGYYDEIRAVTQRRLRRLYR